MLQTDFNKQIGQKQADIETDSYKLKEIAASIKAVDKYLLDTYGIHGKLNIGLSFLSAHFAIKSIRQANRRVGWETVAAGSANVIALDEVIEGNGIKSDKKDTVLEKVQQFAHDTETEEEFEIVKKAMQDEKDLVNIKKLVFTEYLNTVANSNGFPILVKLFATSQGESGLIPHLAEYSESTNKVIRIKADLAKVWKDHFEGKENLVLAIMRDEGLTDIDNGIQSLERHLKENALVQMFGAKADLSNEAKNSKTFKFIENYEKNSSRLLYIVRVLFTRALAKFIFAKNKSN
ncbi:MAG: hypothetical protein Fur003_5900 [Candidatus Dojkabacteria bacterium]